MARIKGNNGNNTLNGTDGSDKIYGYGGDDALTGGAGNDKIYGGSGNDVLRGDGDIVGGSGSGSGKGSGSGSGSGSGKGSGKGSGSGSGKGSGSGSASGDVSFNDYLDGGSGDDIILGELGNDTLRGGSGNDILDGGVGRDWVDGDSGDDTGIFVGGENGGGVDWYDGGTGTDTLVVSLTSAQFADAGIQSDLFALQAFIAANSNALTDKGAKQTFSNLGIKVQDWEALTVLVDGEPVELELDPLFTQNPDGVDFDDVQAGTYQDGTQYDALDGDDVVTLASSAAEAAQAGFDVGQTFNAGEGNDTITGRGLDDKIDGDAGDDVIDGGAGNDLIHGDDSTATGVSETRFASGSASAWSDAGVTLTALDFGGASATVTFNGDGVGVAGGNPVGNQINHSADGSSETLIATFDAPASEATITVARMFATENGGEQGAWRAYDADGNLVGQGEFGPEITGGGNVGSFTISGISPFTEIHFTGREYANGTPSGSSDSSDYFVKSIEYTTLGQPEAGDDVLVGGVGDDIIYGQGGNDIIDGDAPTTIDIRDIAGDDGCYDISGACEVSLTVDFLESLAGYNNSFGYYLAGADGLPMSGSVVWANVKTGGDGVGDAVTITLEADDLVGAKKLGFFIIPNGANKNPGLADGDDVTFVQSGANWSILKGGAALSGQGADVLFSDENQNPGDFDHEEDAAPVGNMNWEDIVGGGDNDFNDASFNVSVKGAYFASGIVYNGATGSGSGSGHYGHGSGSGSGHYANGSGSGSASGHAHGSGSGSGSGRGSGRGSASGSGHGSGRGSGSASGSHAGSGSGGAEVTFNDYLDGGAGDDILDGNLGADFVYGNDGNDIGKFVVGEWGGLDVYDGGRGTDTLKVFLTSEQYADADIQSDLVALQAFIDANSDPLTDSGASMTFNHLDLEVQDWEELEVYVDGKIVQSGDNPADAIDDTANAGEDGPGVVIDVLNNDNVPDGVSSVTIITPPGQGTASVNPDNTITYDPAGDFENLAEGETATVTFTYEVEDTDGDTDIATVTVTVTGTNDDPQVSVVGTDATGAVTEIADGAPGENTDDLVDTGTIAFTDADLSDAHTVSVTENGAGYVGSLGAVIADASTGDGSGSVDWTFTVNDSLLDSLNLGDTLVQSYDVTVDDGNGGTATQTVTVTMTGTNDAPEISFATGADEGTVVEDDATNTVSGQLNGNDVDTGATESWTVVGGGVGTYGALTVDGSGQWTYTLDNSNPLLEDLDTGETDTETFTVELADEHGATATQTVTVTINGNTDNELVTATDDTASADEDGASVIIDVLANDSAPDGVASVTITGGPSEGTATVNPDNSITFDPASDFQDLAPGETRDVTITYELEDTDGDTDTATVTVTVTGTNDAPVVQNVATAAVEDGPAVSGNFDGDDVDSDDDATSLTYDITSTPSEGTVINNGDGTFSFDPGTDFQDLANGETRDVTFEYTATDSHGAVSNTGTVTVTVTGTNDDPTVSLVGTGDSGSVTELTDADAGENVDDLSATGTITYDDTDLSDGHTVSSAPNGGGYIGTFAAVVSTAATGAGAGEIDWTFTVNDSLLESLNEGETIDQSYDVTISDGNGGTVVQTIDIQIIGTNDIPVVQDVTAPGATEDGAAVTGSFDGDDADAEDDGSTLTYNITSTPSEGTVVNNGDGTFSFDPATDFQDLAPGETRDVTFDYTATDAQGAVSNTGTVTVTVTGTNDAPVVQDVASAAVEDGPAVTGSFDGDDADSDDDGTTLTYDITSTPSEGSVINNGDGTFSFDPGTDFQDLAPGETRDVTFAYEATDSHGAVSNTGTVTVTVTGTNDAPVVQDVAASVSEDGPVVVDSFDGDDIDSDDDGTTLTYTITSIPVAGLVINNGDGTFSFDPNGEFESLAAGETDEVTFTYTATDSHGAVSNTSTVTVTINGENDGPVAQDDVFTVTEDIVLTGNVLADNGNGADSDIDATDTISVVETTITTVAGGTVTIAANGSFSYTPPLHFSGTDSFDYTIEDSQGAQGVATANITVIPDADVPGVTVVEPARGNAGDPIPLDITIDFPDQDGSEVHTITICDVPEGATLNNGVQNPDGSWSLTPADLVGLTITTSASAPVFAPSVSLTDILNGDGSQGFVINGIGDQEPDPNAGNSTTDALGYDVSGLGDVNGDGIDDFIVSAILGEDSNQNQGEAYVIFGTDQGFDPEFEVFSLLASQGGDGSKGFVIRGDESDDRLGVNVRSAGDVNGDGINDILTGSFKANPNGNNDAGQAYVIFGTDTGFAAEFNVSTLDGTNGYKINGDPFSIANANDFTGYALSGGYDIDGDGVDDMLIGARGNDPQLGINDPGSTYLVLGGSANLAASDAADGVVDGEINLDEIPVDGVRVFEFEGINTGDHSGVSISGVNDVNGDGIADVLIGARFAEGPGELQNSNSGEAYIVFGGLSNLQAFDAADGFADGEIGLAGLNGTNGFVFNGSASGDFAGRYVSDAGDLNGDGLSDIIIGAYFADTADGANAGEAYVVFGGLGNFQSLDLEDGTADGRIYLDQLRSANGGNGSQGFVIIGENAGDELGRNVRSAGDINGDGFADIIVGAPKADPNGVSNAGASYVIFGKDTGFGAEINLDDIRSGDGSDGFVIDGIKAFDFSGWAVSGAGDVNGDGVDDLIIGAYAADPNGITSGQAYVIFGRQGLSSEDFTLTIKAQATETGNGDTEITLETLDIDINEAPNVDDDTFVIDENSPNGTAVGTAVGTDPDAVDVITYAITGGTGVGVFEIDANTGAITVIDGSALDFETTPGFTLVVEVTDLLGLTDTAVITINLNDVFENQLVDAIDDTANADEDGASVIIDVAANDDIPDGLVSISITSTPSEGSVSVNPDNTISFDPGSDFQDLAPGETRDVTFTYEAEDTQGDTDTATVTVTVTGTNDAPVVQNVATAAVEDGPAVSGNFDGDDVDSDDDATSLTYNITSTPSEGTVINNGDGTFSFDPGTDFQDLADGETRDVTFEYTATDSHSAVSNTGTVTVTVTGTNDDPTVSLVGTDDSGSVTELTDVDAGENVDDLSATGTITYDDADLSDGHTVSSAPNGGGYIGTFAAVVSTAATGAGAGTVDWTFTVNDALLESLNAGETIDQSYDVTIADGNGGAVVQTIDIQIVGTNDIPVVQDVTAPGATEDGAAVTGSFDGDDADAEDDGSSLTYDITTAPSEGSVINNGDGTFSFDPGADFQDLAPGETRDVTFDYTATDAQGAVSNTGTITVTVTGTNDAPVVQDVTSAAVEDGPAVSGSFDGDDIDSDDDGTTLTYTVTTSPSEGSVVNNNDGTFSFDPGADFQDLAVGETRDVTFDYTATDSHGAVSNTGTVTVTVTGTNDDPTVSLVGTDDTGSVTELTDADAGENTDDLVDTGSIAFTDADLSDAHTVSVTENGAGYVGSLGAVISDASTGDGLGSVDWTFTVNDSLLDSLNLGDTLVQSYDVTVDDGNGGTATQTVTVTMTGTNDAPEISFATGADEGTVVEDDATNTVSGQLNGNDVDTGALENWSVVGGGVGTYGALTVDGTGQWTYTLDNSNPLLDDLDTGESETETFTVELADEHGATATQTVTVTINGNTDNELVTATDDTASADEDGASVIIDVLANDSAPDGVASVTITAGPSEGTAVVNPDNTITFDPASDFQDLAPGETRDVTITYELEDTDGDTDTATVTVTVTGTNDAPVVQNVATAAVEDGPSVSGNFDGDDVDSDDDATSLTYDITSTPSEGTVTNNGDGTFSFDPGTDFQDLANGETRDVTFDYTATDSHGAVSNTGTVTVTVTGTNDDPTVSLVGTDDSGSVTELTDGDAGENLDDLSATGTITYDDADLSDGHTVSSAPNGAGYIGAFAAVVSTAATGAAAGTVDWTFTVNDALLESLNEGETIDQSYDVTIADGNGGTVVQTIDIQIIGTNDIPVVQDVTAPGATEDGAAVTGSFDGDDADAEDDGSTLTYNITSTPSEGTVVNNNDGTFSFDPGADFQDLAPGETRDVTFDYTATDAQGAVSNTGTITVTVTGTNDAPVVQNIGPAADMVAAEDGLALTSAFVGDDPDSDDDGSTLTYNITSSLGAGEGSVVNNGDGTFTYDPGTDFQELSVGDTVDVTFDYQAVDSHGAVSNTGVVTITIMGNNDAPIVQNVVSAAVEDGPAVSGSFDGDDIDTDDDATTLTYDITTVPSEGSVINNGDGTFSFDPGTDFQDLAPGETRDVTFDYTATDSHGAVSNTGTVTVTVTGTNDAPVVQDVASAATEDGPAVTGSFDGDDADSDDDGTTLTYDITSVPSEGSVINNGDGTFSFDPGTDFQDLAPGETRDVTFAYEATDSHGAVSNTGTVTVTVTGTNDAPVVQDVAASVSEDGPVVVDSFDGDDIDSDDDGTTLTYTITSIPVAGLVINNGDGTFSFDPNGEFESLAAGESQEVTFTYEATDSHGAVSNTSTVTVTINGENDGPVAQDDVFTVTEDIVLAGNVLADNGNGADSDIDATDTISVVETTITTVAGGTVTIAANGSFSYTPPLHFSGTDSFDYTIEDSQGAQDVATANITVIPDADVPGVTVVEPARGNAGDPIPLDITINFPDQDGSEVHTITICDVPEGATLNNGVQNPDGSWSLTLADLSGLTITTGSAAPVFAGTFNLSDLQNSQGGDGTDGFILNGTLVGIASGFDVSTAGDVNGDGFADILTSAILGDPSGLTNAGYVYLHFGAASNDGEIDLNVADAEFTGYRFDGIEIDDRTGAAVRSAGDINNDGFDDIFIGAHKANPDGNDSGRGFVIYGSAGNANLAALDGDDGTVDGIIKLSELLAINGGDGSKGFVLNGSPETPATSNDFTGYSLGGGIDFNGDGIDDIFIGARGNDFDNGVTKTVDNGSTYIVFGSSAGFGAELNLGDLMDASGFGGSQGLGDGSTGLVIRGINTSDQSGYQLAGVQDMNNDGFDEILIGARQADPNGSNSGQAYIVFGFETTGTPELMLASLDGTNGFTFNGVSANDRLGRAVDSLGDINGDGISDMIFSAYGDDDGGSDAGQSYVVFGGLTNLGSLDAEDGFADGTIELSELLAANGGDGSKGFVITGGAAGDTAGWSAKGAGDINGDGLQDLIIGAPRADANGGNSGTSYVVFGKSGGFGAEIDLDAIAAGNGSEGFALNGIGFGNLSGWSVSAAGDVNGDGVDDLVIGAYGTNNARGDTYVIYGRVQESAVDDFTLTIKAQATETGNGDTEITIDTLDVDINEAPNVENDTFTIDENSANGTAVGTAIGTDPDVVDVITYAITGGTGVGVFDIDASTGAITVIDGTALDFETTPSFTLIVEVTDLLGLTDTGTIFINLNDVFENQLVDAIDDTAGASEDGPSVIIDVAANDDIPDGLASVTIVTGPAEGSAVVNPDNTISFDPGTDFEDLAAGETRDVTFTYEAEDAQGDTDTATVTVTVTGTNDDPTVSLVGTDDTGSVTELTDAGAGENTDDLVDTGSIAFTDADLSDAHTVSVTENGAGYVGSLGAVIADASTGDGSGSVDWTFTVNDSLLDSLNLGDTLVQSYDVTVDDGNGGTATQTVTVTMTGTNDAPEISFATGADEGTVVEDDATNTVSGQLNGNDVDTGALENWSVVGGGVGTYGTLTVDGTGQWTYTLDNSKPLLEDLDTGETDTETFTVELADEHGATATQTVTVTINGNTDNELVTATDDTASADEDGASVIIDVLANDSAPDGVASVTITAGPSEGTAFVNVDNSITFDPASDFQDLAPGETRDVTITYELEDTDGDTDTATVTVTVTGTNDAPVVQNVATAADEDGAAVTGSFDGDDPDSDDDGTTLTYTVTTAPSEGSVVNNNDGTFSFDPGADFQDLTPGETRDVTFDYTATDSHGAVSNIGTVTVTVTGTNDAPVVQDVSLPGIEAPTFGGEFHVNTFGSGVQEGASVLGLSDGRSLIVWHSDDNTAAGSGATNSGGGTLTSPVMGQFFDAAGLPVGTEFLISDQITTEGHHLPDLAELSDGNIAIAWTREGLNNAPGTIDKTDIAYVEIIDPAGNVVQEEFIVAENWIKDLQNDAVSIDALTGGGFVVTWTSHGQSDDFTVQDIAFRVFDNAGNALSPETQANTLTTGIQELPDIAALANGGFVVTWRTEDVLSGDANSGIAARIYDASGTPIGGEFLVNDATALTSEQNPAVAALSGGDFVVIWEGADGIHGQRFDALGNEVGSEFSIGTATSDETDPTIVATPDGGWIVAWTAEATVGGDTNVEAQKYDLNGTKVGDVFVINEFVDNGQGGQGIDLLADGTLIAAWTSKSTQWGDTTDGELVARTVEVPTGHIFEDGPSIEGAFDGDDPDSDDDGTTLIYTVTSTPSEGSVTNNNDGTFSFDPGSDFQDLAEGDTRDVTFEYTATDSHGAVSNTGVVTVTVTGTNDAPVVQNVSASVDEDGPAVIDAFDGDDADSDDDPSTLNYLLTSTPALGILINNGNGTFSFDPNGAFESLAAGETQDVQFTYTATDSHGAVSNTGTVTVTVNGQNDDPVGADDAFVGVEDIALIGNVLADNGSGADSDGDNGASLSVVETSITTAAGGTVTMSSNGDFTYNPLAQFSGVDSFTYTVSDGLGGTDTATVTIDVAAVADAPSFATSLVSGDLDTPLPVNLGVTFPDSDGSELHTIILSDVPDNVTFSNGVKNPDGTWTLTEADLAGLTMNVDSAPVFGPFAELDDLDILNGGDGSEGFILNGAVVGIASGFDVASAGDVNGDGFADVLTSAILADPNGVTNSGQVYIYFGGNSLPAEQNLGSMTTAQGYTFNGIGADDRTGIAVRSAGDVNNDGFDDIFIGAPRADVNIQDDGRGFIVFGSANNTNFADLDDDDGVTDGIIQLSELLAINGGDGSKGFVVNGSPSNLGSSNDFAGYSLGGGIDFNGDGIDDMVIGSRGNDWRIDANNDGIFQIGEERIDIGATYVIFGKSTGFNAEFNVGDLQDINGFQTSGGLGDGSAGIVLRGINTSDQSGYQIAGVRDMDNDGFDELLIGARQADPNGSNSGQAYLVFGFDSGAAGMPEIELASLDGTNGYTFNGINANDRLGRALDQAGDLNGDGIVDIVIGAYGSDIAGNNSGAAYVVFGGRTNLGDLDDDDGVLDGKIEMSELLAVNGGDGSKGFVLIGDEINDIAGFAVSAAGDLNGDGFEDILVGAPRSSADNKGTAGETYVIFGTANGFAPEIDLSDLEIGIGEVGFVFRGIDIGDFSGWTVNAAGDVNGDGIDDVIIGAYLANPNGGASGETYVVYGKQQLGLDDFTIAVTGVATETSNSDTASNDASFYVDIDGNPNNTLIGSTIGGTINGGAGNDLINGGPGDDVINGGAGNDTINGGTGNDIINGEDGDDIINGGDGDDIIDGGAGNNTMDGGAGIDALSYASAANGVNVDLIFGPSVVFPGGSIANFENLVGSAFDDTLTGDDGSNVINGGAGNDFINGRGGDDTLIGGEGNDTLMGSSGDELFIFENGSGDDQILDFTTGAGSDDVIDITDFGFTDFAELLAATNDSGADTVITLDGDDSLTLIGVQEANLHEDDFLI